MEIYPEGMDFLLEPLLDEQALQAFRSALLQDKDHWQAGSATAGWHARVVKNNRQLATNCALHQQLSSKLVQLLSQHPLVMCLAFPDRIHTLLFSRTGAGEGYGTHVDSVRMAQGRSDLSFTVALSDPADYQGGDLVLESPFSEKRLRLPAGHAVVYPSTLLHRVDPVISGERLVAVGWIQSRIRRDDQRELLFDLDTARRTQFKKHGKDEVFDLVTRSYSNLLRLWDDG